MGIYRSKENVDTLSESVQSLESSVSSNTSAISSVPTFTSSTAAPSGGNDGDIWLTYTP